MKHKTPFLLLAILIAVAAMILLPLDVEFTASAIFVAGLVALAIREYAREIKPVQHRLKLAA